LEADRVDTRAIVQLEGLGLLKTYIECVGERMGYWGKHLGLREEMTGECR
jgi:hypothetical protein